MKYRLLLFCLVCFCYAMAQVPVHKEPRHHPVFENKSIRVLNVLLPPGDTTQYHLHATPSVFLCFTKTTTGAQLLTKEPTQSTSSPGYMWFENLAPPHSKVHRVWNADTNVFHVMDVELLSPDSGFAEKPLLLPHLQLEIDTPWARGYKVTLEKDDTIELKHLNASFLIVAIDAAQMQLRKNDRVNTQTVQPGTFYWIPAGTAFLLRNVQNTTARFALFEVH